MEENNTNDLVNNFIDKLTIVKQEYIRLKQYEKVSLRKDVVKVELQNILQNSNTYEDLQTNLKNYIDNLLILKED